MTVRDIQRALIVDKYSRSITCPNFTPKNWFECDVFELTESGYFREYEIKFSLADFKADATKQKTKYDWDTRTNRVVGHKHQSLQNGDPNGPSQFYFITPAGLLSPEIIPQWAGLMEVIAWNDRKAPRNVMFTTVKEAPRLHRVKADPAIRAQVDKVFYYRFHNLFLFGKEDSSNSP